MQMSLVNVNVPHFTNPGKGKPAAEPAKNPDAKPPDTQCKAIELRIIQDGKIYRSKAEQERLVALGEWHHRRRRRRDRYRR